MKNPILNIGYHKTGTTWFQKNLHPHAENTWYAEPGLVRELILKKRALEFDPAEVREYFQKKTNKRVIISHEELSGHIHSGGHHGCTTKEFAHRLKSIFNRAVIVIFIRNQVDMIASVYKQYVRVGGTHSVRKYLFPEFAQQHRTPLFSFEHFNYYRVVMEYTGLFGKDYVRVFLFEDFIRDKIGFLRMFQEALDIEINPDRVSFESLKEGYRSNTLILAKLLNLFSQKNVLYKYYLFNIPRFYELSKKVLDKLNSSRIAGRNVSANVLLGEKNVKFIENYYRESNRILSREFWLNLKDNGYPL